MCTNTLFSLSTRSSPRLRLRSRSPARPEPDREFNAVLLYSRGGAKCAGRPWCDATGSAAREPLGLDRNEHLAHRTVVCPRYREGDAGIIDAGFFGGQLLFFIGDFSLLCQTSDARGNGGKADE